MRLEHCLGVGGGPQGKLSVQSFFVGEGWHLTSLSRDMQACQRPDELTFAVGIIHDGFRKEILGVWQREAWIGLYKEEKWPGRYCGCKRRRQQWAGTKYLLKVSGRGIFQTRL